MTNYINNKKAWDKISESYQRRYEIKTDKIYYGPLCPSEKELKLLGEVFNKKIIEIGSGSGQNSIFLSKKGAKTTAFDFSKKQIEFGKKLAKKNKVNVKFVCGEFEKIEKFFQPESFDLAFSSYALQYCFNRDSLFDTIRQINKILKPNGVFVMSLGHPIRSLGHWDVKEDNFYLNNYFDDSIKEWFYDFPEYSVKAKMVGSFKSISDYINSIIKNGFILTDIIEPKPIKEEKSNKFAVRSRYIKNQKLNPFTFEHLSRIPGTLIIKAIKK
jgi:SAM-dependent methyltransferase